jgi:hypothetical protein
MAFEVVKAMQADRLNWSEGYLLLGRSRKASLGFLGFLALGAKHVREPARCAGPSNAPPHQA